MDAHVGRCAVFAIVDHCTGEAWVDAAPKMDRFAAVCSRPAARSHHRPLRLRRGQRRRRPEAPPRRPLALSLGALQAEIDYLVIDCGPAFRYEPETNGVVEKFMPWIERFDTLEQRRARVRQVPPTTTSTGYSNSTTTAPHPRPANARSTKPTP